MKVLIAGVFCPRDRVEIVNEKRYSEIFGQVRTYTEGTDYAIVNFESTVAPVTEKPIAKTNSFLC